MWLSIFPTDEAGLERNPHFVEASLDQACMPERECRRVRLLLGCDVPIAATWTVGSFAESLN